MSPKKLKKSEEPVLAEPEIEEDEDVEVKTKKVRKSRSKKEETPVLEENEKTEDEELVVNNTTPEIKRKRKYTRDDLREELLSILTEFDTEINKRRESGKGDVRVLGKMRKRIESFKSHGSKLLKIKRTSNSGFSKLTNISVELQKFMGTKETQASRNTVFKFICEYIKTHNLQNPENRQCILYDKDPVFKKLMDYTPVENKQFKYCTINTCLKKHYLPTPKVEVVEE